MRKTRTSPAGVPEFFSDQVLEARRFYLDTYPRLRQPLAVVCGGCEHCHIDTSYLCRLFKRFDSQSPYQYLMRLKMNAAAQRLHAPDALVKKVAYELGYADPFHFSRAFKKVFRISPETFKGLR